MANIIAKLSKCCVCAIIQFLNEESIKPREIHRRLCAVYGQGNVIAKCNIYWNNLTKGERQHTTKTEATDHLPPYTKK